MNARQGRIQDRPQPLPGRGSQQGALVGRVSVRARLSGRQYQPKPGWDAWDEALALDLAYESTVEQALAERRHASSLHRVQVQPQRHRHHHRQRRAGGVRQGEDEPPEVVLTMGGGTPEEQAAALDQVATILADIWRRVQAEDQASEPPSP